MRANTPARGPGAATATHLPRSQAFGSGILPGTVLLTQDGEIPVEFVVPGDRVITRDAGMVRVEEVSRLVRIERAVVFAAGSLGHTRPGSDLVLPAAQAVLVRDWRAKALFGCAQAMVPAEALIDGEFVRELGPREMVLHQLHFAAPHVVYAGGLEIGCGGGLALERAA